MTSGHSKALNLLLLSSADKDPSVEGVPFFRLGLRNDLLWRDCKQSHSFASGL